MEFITSVFWGPLSFLLAFMIVTENTLRYPFQVVVSLGQLYGDVLYYATSMFDHYILGQSYSRPEAAIFWGLFVFLNTFWIFIPLCEFPKYDSDQKAAHYLLDLLYTGVSACKQAFEVLAVSETKDPKGIPASRKKLTQKSE